MCLKIFKLKDLDILILNLIQFLTFIDNHKVGMTIFVDLTNPTEQETNASVLE